MRASSNQVCDPFPLHPFASNALHSQSIHFQIRGDPMKSARSVAILFVLVFAAASCLFSQSSEGRILGTVTDQSGAVVAGARITITNSATNVSRQLTTTGAGEYVAP